MPTPNEPSGFYADPRDVFFPPTPSGRPSFESGLLGILDFFRSQRRAPRVRLESDIPRWLAARGAAGNGSRASRGGLPASMWQGLSQVSSFRPLGVPAECRGRPDELQCAVRRFWERIGLGGRAGPRIGLSRGAGRRRRGRPVQGRRQGDAALGFKQHPEDVEVEAEENVLETIYSDRPFPADLVWLPGPLKVPAILRELYRLIQRRPFKFEARVIPRRDKPSEFPGLDPLPTTIDTTQEYDYFPQSHIPGKFAEGELKDVPVRGFVPEIPLVIRILLQFAARYAVRRALEQLPKQKPPPPQRAPQPVLLPPDPKPTDPYPEVETLPQIIVQPKRRTATETIPGAIPAPRTAPTVRPGTFPMPSVEPMPAPSPQRAPSPSPLPTTTPGTRTAPRRSPSPWRVPGLPAGSPLPFLPLLVPGLGFGIGARPALGRAPTPALNRLTGSQASPLASARPAYCPPCNVRSKTAQRNRKRRRRECRSASYRDRKTGRYTTKD